MRDVAVVGAGPAGLLSARILASLGHDVVVLEEHDTVGVPVHCTGLLGLDAFGEFDLPRHTIMGTADRARFVAADNRDRGIRSARQGKPLSLRRGENLLGVLQLARRGAVRISVKRVGRLTRPGPSFRARRDPD